MRIAGIFMVGLVSLSHYGAAHAQGGQSESVQDEKTLCSEDEDVYFSCPLENGKTISVCAKGNTSPNQGYVQYRYGTRIDAFPFPAKSIAPTKVLGITDVSEGSIRGLHLKFFKGLYTYVVSSVPPGGVYVSKNGKIIFDKICQASQYKSFSNKVFDGINQSPVLELDMH
ncbi:hypothetical protein BM43_595 [Burkholderia gladioli]|uniref:Uncharacterized protein n=2 Tax=Burkholderia gladioli TaxID=28095 RepID=A0AAW3F8Z1_BURGA|nr:hypothetical protein BM43_595 [Burkholderia gladioli]AWY54248.1 hypothetical protein A8H28_24080 [Burkholderia gladioli pv. gladioli]KGC16872.1 hypothetical protein DM48_5049 [Burkholderia gladioli]SPU83341.1 Uncharacterised protein [Burkholderia gladioli]